MITLLLTFLLWIPIASFVATAVTVDGKSQSKTWKKILFIAVAAPVLWVHLIDVVLSRRFGSSLSSKIGLWFNS